MQSRMDRYNTNSSEQQAVSSKFEVKESSSRQARNRNLYENVGDTELDNFDVNSNVSVIGDNSKNINLDNLRDMLDRKYREPEVKKTKEVYDDEEVVRMNLAETREYDLRQILEQARANKETSYEEERLMKLHNTQYDILKNLNIYGEDRSDNSEDVNEVEVSRPRNANEQRLMDLIDTINENEFRNTQELALDILSDLTGDDDSTKVLGAVNLNDNVETSREAIREDSMNTTQILNEARMTVGELEDEYAKTQMLEHDQLGGTTQILEQAQELNEEQVTKEENIEEVRTEEIPVEVKENIEEIELPKTREINKTDIVPVEEIKKKHDVDDDFADIKEDSLLINFLLKLIIIIIVVLFIVGGIYLANRFLGLGLF